MSISFIFPSSEETQQSSLEGRVEVSLADKLGAGILGRDKHVPRCGGVGRKFVLRELPRVS